MILKNTKLFCADNSGVEVVKCIYIPGGFRRSKAILNEVILVAYGKQGEKKYIKKKTPSWAVILSTKKNQKRFDGSYLKFDKNKVILLSDFKKFLGSRIYGPITKEIYKPQSIYKIKRIVSYADLII